MPAYAPASIREEPMSAAVGAAVDVGRWLHARDQTVAAVDAVIRTAAANFSLVMYMACKEIGRAHV